MRNRQAAQSPWRSPSVTCYSLQGKAVICPEQMVSSVQTKEALQHAQQAGCPIILAITKCDMPGADPARVKTQLLSAGLLLEEAGGNVLVRIASFDASVAW